MGEGERGRKGGRGWGREGGREGGGEGVCILDEAKYCQKMGECNIEKERTTSYMCVHV